MAREALVGNKKYKPARLRPIPRRGSRPIPNVGPWRWWWIAVLAWLVAVYLLVNFRLPRILPAGVNIYLAQPLAWSSLALSSYLGWRYGLTEKPKVGRSLVVMAGLTGAFQVALFVIGGVFLGFGHSPYAHRFPALIGNLLFAATQLLGIEMSRAYLLARLGQRSPTLVMLLSALFFSFINLPIARFTSLGDVTTIFKITGETFLPNVAENLLASFLALIGGPVASISYRGVLQVFEWLSPILPRLTWMVTAFIGTIAPILGMLVIRSQVMREEEDEASRSQQGQSMAWVLVGVMAVSLLWFNTGIFGVRPTLVSGVSMEPNLLAGDVVITREVPAESIEVGDVVRFKQGGVYILHRVIEVQESEGEHTFITQGDANNVVDAPVPASQIEGKVILTIPKIGWVSIAVREVIGWFR